MKKGNSREWEQEAPGPYWGPPDDYKDYTCADEDINLPSGQISLIKRQDSEITSTSTDLEILDLRTNVKVKEVPKIERLEALDLRTNIKKGILNEGCSKATLNGSGRALDLRISNVVSLKGINPTPSCVPDILSDCGTINNKSAKSRSGTKSVDTTQTTCTEAAKETRLINRVLMNKLPSMTHSDCGTLNHKLDKSSTITKPVDTEQTSGTEAAMGHMAIKRVLRNKLLSMNFTKRLITPSCVSETLSDCGTLNHKSDKSCTNAKNADTKQTARTAATKEPYRAIKRVLRNKLLSMNIANRLITLNVAKHGLIPSNTEDPGGTRDEVAKEVESESNPGHCVPDVNMEHAAANGHIGAYLN